MKTKLSILFICLIGLWACSENEKEADINEDKKEQEETVGIFSKKFTQKILLEDYTATWCGYCPRLLYPMTEITEKNKNVIALAIHGSQDPMYFSHIGSLANAFGVQGYPTGKLNRTQDWTGTEDELSASLAKDPTLGIAIETSIDGENFNASVKVGFNQASNPNLKLVVMVSEDGLIHDQSNYLNDYAGPWNKKGNPIKGFEHKHVLKSNLTDIFGDAIPADKLKDGNQYTLKLSKKISELKVKNHANSHIVAFVVNANREVINVQQVKLGENKAYDFKN